MSKAYEDVGKDGADLLAKGFPNSGTFKITAETKAPNGVTIVSTGSRSFAPNKKTGGLDEKLAGIVEPKYEIKAHNVELTGKLSTAGEYEGGIALKDLGTKGTKFTITDVFSDANGASVKASGLYKNDVVATKVGVVYPFKSKTFINYTAEIVAQYPKNVFFGTEVKYNKAKPGEGADQPVDELHYNVKAGLVHESQQVTVSIDNPLNGDSATKKETPRLSVLNIGYFNVLSDALKFAFGFSVERKNVKPVEFNTGAEYKVDKDTVVKGKFTFVGAPDVNNREFRVGLGVKQNVSERVNVTVGADINARALLGSPASTLGSTKPHSFGFEVKFQ